MMGDKTKSPENQKVNAESEALSEALIAEQEKVQTLEAQSLAQTKDLTTLRNVIKAKDKQIEKLKRELEKKKEVIAGKSNSIIRG